MVPGAQDDAGARDLPRQVHAADNRRGHDHVPSRTWMDAVRHQCEVRIRFALLHNNVIHRPPQIDKAVALLGGHFFQPCTIVSQHRVIERLSSRHRLLAVVRGEPVRRTLLGSR